MDEEIRQALTEVREMKKMCGNINMKLTNIVTQRGQDWKKKLEAEYQRGLEDGKAVNDKGCEGCLYNDGTKEHSPCDICCNAYLNRWTAKQTDENVKRGDVVRHKINGLTYIVTLASDCGYVLLGEDGNFATRCITNIFEKTGKHFDIDKILEAMKA